MIGFEEEFEMLIEKLVTGPRQLDVISIVGMPGLGKTTLAKRLYTHGNSFTRFDIRMWCCCSQLYVKKNILFGLLRQTSNLLDSRINNMVDDELAEMLYKHLKGKRYLIVVDDVWSPEAWDDIRRPFPDDNNGSRIILTTRLESIAAYAKISSAPYFLRLFTKEESWMLLEKSVFGRDNCPKIRERIGKHIAKKCGGLPLAVVLIAGRLAKHSEDVVYWKQIAKSLKSRIRSGCMDVIESSYQHLPKHLKKCFLYFASFVASQNIPVEKLIRVWIAERFVKASTSKGLEMLALEYLMDLISSNLVMVAKISTLGELKAVHIHDLLHEYCLAKAKRKNFLLRVYGVDELHAFETRCKRVNILATREVLLADKFPFTYTQEYWLRTLRFLPSVNPPFVDFSHSWRSLRVLDLGSVGLRQTLLFALEYLVQLKYLELQMYFLYIPYSISKLTELETFVVTGDYGHDSIPNNIWSLVSLRHLHISPLYILRDELEDLDNLQTCSNLVIFPGRDYQKFMKRFPSLEKLSCQLYGSGTPFNSFIPAFDSIIQLKSLKINVSGTVVDPYGFEDFTYPSSLKKLTLACLDLPWSKLSNIGRLSNLKVLKLERNAFSGGHWDVKDGEFPNLKVLKLKNLLISEWTASDDSYPSLQKILVQRCWNLEAIPYSFGNKCTMQLIEVRSCRDSVVNAALKIKEMQIEEMGHSEFNVIIWK